MDSMLIDWRAPAAAVFYQATAADPQSVVRRRVLRCSGRTVPGVEDELLDAEALEESGVDLPIIGEGALMAQLSRARDRSMHSIVATIQAEQDLAIRAPSKGVVTISGGPGTGKTVVALHRAAYLLYTDRRRYEAGGVLIVGPSGVFMRYIERVLPSLGETAVALRSLGEVVDGVRATRHDEPAVADVKGSVRMAELMRRTSRQQAPGSPTRVPDVLVRQQHRARPRRARPAPPPADVAGSPQPAAAAGRRRAARRDVAAGARRARPRARSRGVRRRPARRRDFLDFALAWWPPLDAPTVLSWLRDPEFLARVAEGVLTAEEQRLLTKSWAGGRRASLSVEDVPLLDELRYALGDVPRRTEDERDDPFTLIEGAVDIQELMTASDREYAPTGRAWTPPTHSIEDDAFAHVLIDEAQDLTPMQWRMVGRRGRAASWTIVGDPAQSSWPQPGGVGGRPGRRRWRASSIHEFHLSKNYRNSAEIYEFAALYAERVGLDADLPTRSARPAWTRWRPTAAPDLEAATRQAVPRSPGRSPARSASWCPRPAARRSTPGWPRGRSSTPTPPARRRRSTPRSPRRAATGSSCSPASTPRAWSSTGSSSSGPRRSRPSRSPARATLYVVLTRATQLLTTVS